MAKLTSILGIPIDSLPSGRRLSTEDFPAPAKPVRSRTHADLLRRRIASDRPTLDELLALPEVLSSGHWQVVGTPADAVEKIKSWRTEEAMDGFIALPGGSMGSLDLFLTHVVPLLREAGTLRPIGHDNRWAQASTMDIVTRDSPY